MIRILVAATLLYLAAAVAIAAYGAPPEGSDPDSATARWFRSLIIPGTEQTPCCGWSDGRAVEYRVAGDHYEALVGRQFPDGPEMPTWIAVPSGRVLTRTDNPTGRAVLFWRPGTGVLCFVLPAQV
jgi:hypothetical protein